MSVTRRIFFGAAAGWIARGVTMVLGLVLMPILFRHLPKEELGVWLLLGQSWAALGIFDLGFGATLTRRIAFAKGKSSADPNAPLSEAAVAEIAELVATGQRVYHALSIFAFLFSFTAGFFYLRTLDLHNVPLTHVWVAWGVLCLCQAVNVWATIWDCLLQGVGYIGWDAILGSCATTLILSAQIVAVLLGASLVTLAVIAAVGGVIQRYLWRGFALSRRPELVSMHGHWKKGLIGNMTPLALRAWLTALGSGMILYTDQILIASLRGAADIPPYRAAWVLIHNVTIVAVNLGLASGVFISQLWQAGQIEQVHRILIRNVRLGWVAMLSCSAVLLVFGKPIFTFWLKVPGSFAGYRVIAAFLIS
jgi:O-antigen/teichoic acid export membrane protein